ncbi:MAG: polysaccharide deacetylase family protein [Planctomycetota bacterium]
MNTVAMNTPDETWTRRYDQLSVRTPRSIGRGWVLDALAWGDRLSVRRTTTRPNVQILLLHHVFADEVDDFRRLIAGLADGYDFVSYTEAVRIASGETARDRDCLAFSFDDGLKSCLTAARVLEEFNATACFFVCPSVVGLTDHRVIERFCRDRLGMPATELMGWADLERLASCGHEIGNHTMRHPRVANLAVDEMAEEIGAAHEVLAGRFGVRPHFAWPYGKLADFNALAARVARDVGVRSIASGVRGAHRIGPPIESLRPAPLLRRQSLVAGWPIRHGRHFLRHAASKALSPADSWPKGWVERRAA